jgi:outer membrane cobalamin receptor
MPGFPAALCAPARLPAVRTLSFALASWFGTAATASPATIAGVVRDPERRPVARATVLVESGALVRSGTTGDEGRFVFDSLPAGRYRVWVARDGFRAVPRAVLVGADETADVDLLLQVSAVSETVVVSASQIEAPLSIAPASVTVVSGADLAAHQVDSLADALRTVPGIALARSGTRGAVTSVFPRGGESDYTLVLLDGVRVNGFGGTFDFANLAAANVERIEVVRGPQSALYGADAIGGVVQIITRRGGAPRVSGVAEGGSDDTTRLAASASGSTSRWLWGAGMERFGSDGGNGDIAPSGERIGNDDFARLDGSASLGYATATWQARTSIHAGRSERGFPGPFGSDPNGTYSGIDLVSRGRNTWRGTTVAADGSPAARLRLRGAVSRADLDSRFRSPFGSSFTETARTAGRVQADVVLAAGTSVSAGVEATGERARNTYVTGEAFQPVPITRRVVGSFAELRAEATNRLLVTAGVRVEHIRRDRLEGDPSPFGGRPRFSDDTVVSANPKVAASWFLRPPAPEAPGLAAGHRAFSSGWTRVRASAGTGIRPPDAFEIAFTDNPSLKPERSRSVDAGVEHAVWGGAAIVEATLFSNRYDDLIVAVGRDFTDASRYRTDNISNARSSGLELAVSARLGGAIDLRGSYTRLDTKVLAVDGRSGAAPPPFTVGDPLLRRPRHQGSVHAIVRLPRGTAFGRLSGRGRMLDVDPSFGAFGGTVPGPGYAVVDAGVSFALRPGIELLARATNLFDRQHEEVAGYPALGRSVMAGVRVARGR